MSDELKDVVAQGKDVYRDVVARSWAILVAQTDASDPTAIEATCELQRNLVVVGAEWLRLCEQVLALAANVPASAVPSPEPETTTPAPTVTPPSAVVEPTQEPPQRTLGRSDAPATTSPNTQQDGARPRTVTATPAQAAHRIFPLIMDAAPAHVQLVAMSFNGAEWHPIAAWRRIYQQVIQSLQRSDPERFDTLGNTMTMSNGKPLFSRDRSVYMAPIDAGGGWFATGQMPTELILQRLRTLVDWWGLPRESLSVEVMPEATAPSATRPSDAEPSASNDGAPSNGTPELEPSTGARAEDIATLSEEAPAHSIAEIEPAIVDAAPEVEVATTALAELPADELAADEVFVVDVPEPAAVSDEQTIEDTEVAAQVIETSGVDILPVGLPVSETPVAEDEPLLDEQVAATPAPSEDEVITTTFTPDEILVEDGAADTTADPEPEPANDPVNGTEASVISSVRRTLPLPVAQASQAVTEPPSETVVDEFVPPPMARSSNVRWVKTINGTRLPLRPAEE